MEVDGQTDVTKPRNFAKAPKPKAFVHVTHFLILLYFNGQGIKNLPHEKNCKYSSATNRQYSYNVTMIRVLVTIVAVEKQ